MKLPTIRPAIEVGARRPPCEQTIRVAASGTSRAARYAVWKRSQEGIPVDQCGQRSDFTFAGVPLCRAHAGQRALRFLIEGQSS